VIRRHSAIGCAVIAALLGLTRTAGAQTVTITVPAAVSFNVIDVAASTSGVPNLVTVNYSNPLLFPNSAKLKVSVRADASAFSGPGVTHIDAAKVSWTATATNGTASNGTLSSAAYGEVYRSPANLKATSTGSVSLHWTLAPVAAAGLRAGTHTLTVRWKFEAL
jgi:hypothetical protein